MMHSQQKGKYMQKLIKFSGMALVFTLLSGCVIAINDDDSSSSNNKTIQAQRHNQSYISSLQSGASQQSIRSNLGVPDFSESFNKNGETIEVLFYRTHHTHGDGMTTKDECTALIFKAGVLTAWGDKAYQQL
jgi:outer membrane protein assembly factor BamE (lipoprotein component of BamABCDE complex)